MDSAINSNNADICNTDDFVHMPMTCERKKKSLLKRFAV